MKPLLFLLLILTIPYQGRCQTGKTYLMPQLAKGDSLANIYSRTITYSGDSFAPLVFRISGTSTYQVTDNNPLKPVFQEADLYDGRPISRSVSVIGLDGNNTYQDKTYTNTSASSLLYNELIWGPIPASVREGDTWQNKITIPWELGGVGTQTVKVISIDEQHQTITLQREGHSEGPHDNDPKQLDITTLEGKKLRLQLKTGTSHWTGITTFRKGIVISDELIVTRPVLLSDKDAKFNGYHREYILLNAMPYQSL